MAQVIKPITARRKLELSQLDPKAVQREAMGEDVDFKSFAARLSGLVKVDLEEHITAAKIARTIEGASTITVTVNDFNRSLLRSGLLSQRLDVDIDGLWFRMTQVDKSSDDLDLIFQDREIEILRTYHNWRIAQRGQMTRAEFVLSMIREVKEFNIPVVIPELHKVQPIEKYAGDLIGTDTIINKSKGISPDINTAAQDAHRHGETNTNVDPTILTVKGATATSEQIQNANIALMTGDSMGVSRKLKVIAIMTAITESRIINNPGGDADSAGLYQQRPGWGSYLDRTDVETSSRLFYKAALKVEAANPDQAYWFICAETQHPREDLRREYAKWRVEAERFVNAYGDVGIPVNDANAMSTSLQTYGGSAKGPFYFYRGKIVDKRGLKIRKPENTWDCIQRLGDEVDWRGFFVSGRFYFISEADLFKQQPAATITEFTEGISSFDFSYDNHKKSATIDIEAEVGRWQIPPGSVVVIKEAGPVDGRWLVNDYERDLIGSNKIAKITLKKPRPQLPEPSPQGNAQDLGTGASWLPQASSNLPPTQGIASRVLNDKRITFSNALETSDIQFGLIDDRVLQFLEFMTSRGYTLTVTALKSDHSQNTTEGNRSAHSVGKAVDIGTVSNVVCADNPATKAVMEFIKLYQPQLGFDQLIGPFPLDCIPRGYYDSATLDQHKNHIHVGWPI